MKSQSLFQFLLVVILLVGLLSSPPGVSAQEETVQDVILLIDNSGSMWDPKYGANDRENWRYRASEVVFNFMYIQGEPGVRYRIGVISYAEEAVSLWDLSEVQQSIRLRQVLENSERGNIKGSYTDHAKALKLAADQLEQAIAEGAQRRPPVLILLTDGNLQTSGRPSEEFLQDLETQMERLKSLGAVVHVVLFGAEAASTEDEWQRLGAYPTRRVETANDLAKIYHELINRTTGRVPVEAEGTQEGLEEEIQKPEANRKPVELTANLDPNEKDLIEAVIVTVVSPDANVGVTFCHWDQNKNRCDGELYPIPGQREVVAGRYVVTWRVAGSELLSGEWRVKVTGTGDAAPTLLISYIPLQFRLIKPTPGFRVAPGETIPIQAVAFRGNFPTKVPETVEVYAYLCGPPPCTEKDSQATPVLLECRDEECTGEISAEYTGPAQVMLGARLRLSQGGHRDWVSPGFGPQRSGALLSLPEIGKVSLDPPGRAEIGEPISLTVWVNPVPNIQGLRLYLYVYDAEGREVLRSELTSRTEREWELPTPVVLRREGTYRLVVEGHGSLNEGIAFGTGTPYPMSRELKYEIYRGTIAVEPRRFTDRVEQRGKITAEFLVTTGPGITVKEIYLQWEGVAAPPIILRDDGMPPDRLAGDGIWSGESRAPSQKGSFRMLLLVRGENRFGEELQFSSDLNLEVIPPWYSLERIWPYLLALLVLMVVGGGIWAVLRPPVPPLTGTLVVRLPGGRSETHDLGQYIRPITIGFDQGTLPLPKPPNGTAGLKARLEGKWERTPFGREVVVWLYPLRGSRIQVAGSSVDRRGLSLSDGMRIDIEGLTLEYRR